MRKFSSYGPVDKDMHYYVPRTELIQEACLQLRGEVPEKSGHYITVWAPRQCGKTWIMNEVMHTLKRDSRFHVLKLELESLKRIPDAEEAAAALGDKIVENLELDHAPIRGTRDFEKLFQKDVLKKPLILICDEFDALEETAISGIVSIFRNIYNSRLKNPNPSDRKEYLLHGAALIGVRSVLGIENVTGSPFNVQRSMHIPNLSFEEIQSMFRWYEKESGHKIEPEVIEGVYRETLGQPGLVSWFGELLTEGYDGYKPDRSRPVAAADFAYTFKRAVQALPNNNILNIISKAKQTPYRETVLELFRTDRKTEFAYDEPHQNFLYMNGVTGFEDDGENLYVRFSCPFVQKRLFNYFSREIFRTADHLYDPMTDIEAVVGEDEISIPGLMDLYRTYLAQNRDWLLKDAPRRKTDLRIYEAVFHFNLYMYLKAFFQDKGADVFPEFPTGNGKIDILIRYGEKCYALELKSFRDRYAYKKSLSRAAEYAAQLRLKQIFLILFIEAIDDGNRQILEAVYCDKKSGIQVIPIFVETGNAPGV